MSADLPPDVRDRAAERIKSIFWNASYRHEDDQYLAMVDAVAEVLAAEQSGEIPHWRTGELIRRINTVCAQRDQLDAENLLLREQAGDMAEELELLRAERELYRSEGLKIQADRDALNVRVAELSTEHLHLSHEVEALEEWNFWLSRTLRDMARRVTSFRSSYYRTARESTRYVIERNEARARVDLLTTALTGPVDMQFSGAIHRSSFEHVRREALWENARAVLSATPTEDKP